MGREYEPCGGCALMVPINERTVTTGGLRCRTCQRVQRVTQRTRDDVVRQIDHHARMIVKLQPLLNVVKEAADA